MNIQLSGFININKLYDRRLSFSIYYNYVNWLIVIIYLIIITEIV